MLAERLYEFASALQADFSKTDVVSKAELLSNQLRALGQNPTQPTIQTAAAQARTELEKAARASATRQFPPSWKAMLKDCDLERYFGDGLLARVSSILQKNGLTPAQAAQDIKELSDKLKAASDAISGLLSGLDWFEVKPSSLLPGQFEIDVTIPCPAIDNDLSELGSEFVKIGRIVGFFEEITSGSRSGAKIIAIGSSDPTAFIQSHAAAAAAFAIAIERVVAFYGKVLEIRKAHADLKKAGLPDNALEGVRAHIEQTIKDGLDQQAKFIRELYIDKAPQDRRAELATEAQYVLGQLAERVDDGYRFDVRGMPARKDDPAAEEIKTALETIAKHRPSLISFDHLGTPVLRLSDRRTEENSSNVD